MTWGEKCAYVREALDLVAGDAQKLKDGRLLGESSIGLVAAPGGSGGFSGRTSDFTAMKALSDAMDSVVDKKARDWYGLASDTYVILRSGAGKTPGKGHRDKLKAHIFLERVMNGKRIAKIANELRLHSAVVSKCYSETITLCVTIADMRGMIP